jgi:hypothetical protein
MKYLVAPMTAFAAILLLTGCATSNPHSEFVKTVNFSSLDTFSFKHSLISGMDFRESEEMLLEQLTERTITSELLNRGFELSADSGDFYAVVKWKKAVSSYPGPFDHIDGFSDSLNRRDNPAYKFNSRMHLTLEIYEASTRNLFWRNELPNIFDSVQLTEERIVESLKRSIRNFPNRIEKDPNLPSIE